MLCPTIKDSKFFLQMDEKSVNMFLSGNNG